MKLRGLTPLFVVSLAAVVFATTGCGSSKSSSSTTSSAATASPPTTTTFTTPKKTKKKVAGKLHAGQYCTVSKESTYVKLGYRCVGGRLKKAGTTTTSTKTTKTTPTTTTTSTTTTTGKKYKAGQICSISLEGTYAAQHLACVNGRLKAATK